MQAALHMQTKSHNYIVNILYFPPNAKLEMQRTNVPYKTKTFSPPAPYQCMYPMNERQPSERLTQKKKKSPHFNELDKFTQTNLIDRVLCICNAAGCLIAFNYFRCFIAKKSRVRPNLFMGCMQEKGQLRPPPLPYPRRLAPKCLY